ncbi:uncharacterized protein I303_102022 [Kwoniella dejecticola CBS 10117]|uniref:F-box domain-containing protein n=1 Tax=Kwoniella dejecticola CBS 10117 TaxID=1296121 RepID=A0A1A6AC34_9TREE|nr:uncharacterized protein I303_01839 [Kwoniella dejecticola CBS 10117]OBR87631.1 hypothetical protein I303_01839 [Kwoniella dejecticola CBS 10117]
MTIPRTQTKTKPRTKTRTKTQTQTVTDSQTQSGNEDEHPRAMPSGSEPIKPSTSQTKKRSKTSKNISSKSSNPDSNSSLAQLEFSVDTLPARNLVIPNEIILHILNFLALANHQTTLFNCSLSSKKGNKLSSPFLWKNLHLTPWSSKVNDNRTTKAQLESANPKKISCGHIGSGKKPLHHLLKHVETFHLDSHTPEWCNHTSNSNLKLPNLRLLELTVTPHAAGHRKMHITDPLSRGTYADGCRLLRDIRPEVVVLRDNFNAGLDLSNGAIPKSIWNSVEELILVSPVMDIPSLEREPLVADIPLGLKRSLRTLTWIFTPVNAEEWEGRKMYRLDDPHRPDYGNATQVAHLILQLEVDKVEEITLVNVGLVAKLVEEDEDEKYEELHYDAKDYILVKIAEEARKRDWTERKIGGVVDKVKVVMMREYIERGAWEGKFERQELENWEEGTKRLF